MHWIWFALLNALAIAAVGLAQKRALRDEHSLEFVTITTVLRLLLFYVIFWRQVTWVVTGLQFFQLALMAVLAGTGFLFVSKALRRQDLSAVFPVINLDAALAALLALIFLREALTPQQLLGLIVLIVGTYLLQLTETKGAPPDGWKTLLFPFRKIWRAPGGHYALLGMMAYAVSAVVDRFVLKHISWQTYLAYLLPLMMVYFFLLSAARRHSFSSFRSEWRRLLPWAVLVAVLYLMSNIANSIAMSLAAVGLVVAIKRSSTLIDILASGKIFHEQAVIQKALAASVMLIGLFLILTA